MNGVNGHDKAHEESHKYDGEQVEHTEYAGAPTTYGGRFKRHCARRWWLHVLIFCIIFLIIALCLVYAAMPHIAQHGVDESSIEFTALQFLDPTSDSIVLTQNATLHSPSMYTPTLDPFNASLYLVTNGVFSAEPMTYIQMPTIHALHPESNDTLTQRVPIADMAVLTEYATQVLSNYNVTTALVGKTKLHEGKLPVVTVNYNSSSTYRGLNGLQGFNVTGVRVNISALAGEPNLKGFAYIPNPSVLTVAMGNVTLTVSTAQQGVVGTTSINDMTLVPGNNTLAMTGTVNQTALLASLNATGFAILEITGNSSIYNGQHLTYYEAALASNKLTLPMNVNQVVKDSLGL
jgi:hypothetical protein